MVLDSASKASRRRFTDTGEPFATVLGSGLAIEGTLRGAGDLEMRGNVKGTLEIDGLVWIKRQARLEGELAATAVVIEGELIGNVVAKGKVDLRSGCRFEGDLTAGAVAAADGSFFEGRITMSGGKSEQVVTYQEKRDPDQAEQNSADGQTKNDGESESAVD